jgi:hypothetical protein
MRRFALVKLWVKLGLHSYHASKGVFCEPIAQFPSLCLLGRRAGDLPTAAVARRGVAHCGAGLDFWLALSVGLGRGHRKWVD